MHQPADLAAFLRDQARSADFGHDRERFASAAGYLDKCAVAFAAAEAKAAASPPEQAPAKGDATADQTQTDQAAIDGA
jgi:hypothetical protein